MTLEQSFPGLRSSPGGAIIAVADNLFDITGPETRFQMESMQDQARHLTTLIKDLDPGWNYNGIGATDAFGTPIVTLEGLTTKVNDLRFQHAAIRARIKEDYGPLQVETLRFVQRRTNAAYDDGMLKLKAGRLSPKLSEREALGNYIDRKVREDLVTATIKLASTQREKDLFVLTVAKTIDQERTPLIDGLIRASQT